MFTAKILKDRMEQKPFRPFRIRMSNGEAYDIPNHDAAWVLRDSVEIGLDPDASGLVSLTRRCSILHIASIEDLQTSKAA
ncbi:MAG TPA: hypothetical protein VFR76_01910 [Verrucomicrobiae bacterium]|nr:hypothetical protein [Verrucomicrobiae bacterium]